jgi:flagellar biogenesis protein FliO
VASLAKALEAEPVPVAAREPAANGSSSATAAVVAPTSAPSAWLLLTIGLVLLVACLGLLVLVVRRLRPQRQGSFISRSMEPR